MPKGRPKKKPRNISGLLNSKTKSLNASDDDSDAKIEGIMPVIHDSLKLDAQAEFMEEEDSLVDEWLASDDEGVLEWEEEDMELGKALRAMALRDDETDWTWLPPVPAGKKRRIADEAPVHGQSP